MGNTKSNNIATNKVVNDEVDDVNYDNNDNKSDVIDDMVFVVGNNSYGELGVGHREQIKSLISFNKEHKNIQIKNINIGYLYGYRKYN